MPSRTKKLGEQDGAGRKGVPRRVTLDYVRRAAMAYLERYASSTENLRRVLQRKVMKRCRQRDEDPMQHHGLIEEAIAAALRAGLVDDDRYAQAKAASLRRRGRSARAIQARLSAKGIDRTVIAAALDSTEDTEEEAAHVLARRRKLGPYRLRERAVYRDKDMAALCRAGFSFDIVRRLMEDGRDAEARSGSRRH